MTRIEFEVHGTSTFISEIQSWRGREEDRGLEEENEDEDDQKSSDDEHSSSGNLVSDAQTPGTPCSTDVIWRLS